ncbi:MAG TPA: hypothetical protein VE912_26170, partial [Bacteroidales bacterium]|nr:hypothetical protein [Bacteroidales bacterium]
YTRLLACYELVFGKEQEFRQFIFQEVLSRFVMNRQNQRDNALLNEMIYLANAGRIKEYWHYHFNNNKRELYINLSQCYEAYRNSHRDHSLSMNQFRDILKTYFEQHGGYETGSPKWYGRYTDDNYKEHVINRTQHSYVLQYYQVGHPDNLIKELFPIPEEVQPVITSIWEQYKSVHKLESEPEDLKDEAPF